MPTYYMSATCVLRSSLSCCVHALTKLLPCAYTYTGLPEGSRDTTGIVLGPEGRARDLDGRTGQTHCHCQQSIYVATVFTFILLPHAQTRAQATNVKMKRKPQKLLKQ